MKVEGKVIDLSGEPLPLSNITLVSGINANKIGVVADDLGNFVFDDESINEDSKIRVSYIGYKSQDFVANELLNKDNTITLVEESESLDEVSVMNPTSEKPISKQLEIKKKSLQLSEHLQKHKMIYAGLGAFLGIALIVLSIRKLNK